MARTNEEADIYAEAIELALGDVEITKYLANQMVSPNDTLREASVAAITNQGTLTAVELLSKHVEERGDPMVIMQAVSDPLSLFLMRRLFLTYKSLLSGAMHTHTCG